MALWRPPPGCHPPSLDSFNSLVLVSVCRLLARGRGGGVAHHHAQELVVVHLPVPVRVHPLQHRVDLLFSHHEVVRLQTLAQLLPGDAARVVFVEVGEGGLEVVLLQVAARLETGRNELSVVDQAILVAVNNLHRALHVIDVYLDLRALLQPVDQLLNRQLPVAIHINLGKDLPQQLDLVLGDTRRNQV